ncbi:hypothetical protein IG631_02866 [Alternaria alternata]|nr:hypothetical protein IG631_02866 [Alternaria alternata]
MREDIRYQSGETTVRGRKTQSIFRLIQSTTSLRKARVVMSTFPTWSIKRHPCHLLPTAKQIGLGSRQRFYASQPTPCLLCSNPARRADVAVSILAMNKAKQRQKGMHRPSKKR